jgi:hypothetical protein
LGPIPNPQSPIPNPQSPIPNPHNKLKLMYKYLFNNINKFKKLFNIIIIILINENKYKKYAKS